MANQIPLNDDTGSELVRELLRQFNNLKADFDAYKAAVEGAADFATAQADSAALELDASSIEVDLLPPRVKNYGVSK